MEPTDTLILKGRVQRRHERRLTDAGGAVNVSDDRSSLYSHLAQEAQFRIASHQGGAASPAYQVGDGPRGHEAISSITHPLIMTSSIRSVYVLSHISAIPALTA